MLLPHAIHLKHRGVREARLHARLTQEALQTRRVRVTITVRAHSNRQLGGARRNRDRQIFFDRNRAIKCGLIREVDDAETTFTDQSRDREVT